MNSLEQNNDRNNLKQSLGQDITSILDAAYEGKKWSKLHDQIENAFTFFSPEETQQILKENLKKAMVKRFNQALNLLKSPQLTSIFQHIQSINYQEYLDIIRENPEEFRYSGKIIQMDKFITTVASDGYVNGLVKFSYYPFKKYICPEGEDLGEIVTNIGHDIHNIPLIDYPVLSSISFLHQFPDYQIAQESSRLLHRIYPSLYQGCILTFEAYRDMARNYYPMTNINLGEILKIVRDEALERIFLHCVKGQEQVRSLVCANDEYINQNDDAMGSCKLNVEFDDGLDIRGNAGAFKLMLYQFMKNTISYLRTGENAKKEGLIDIKARKIHLTKNSPEVIAIRIIDNGPGLDFSKILREKQKILNKKTSLTDPEKTIAGDWTCLNLTLFDITKMIFERRVSGHDRIGKHSGIGLSIAMNIIDMHGASIWATNISAGDGAKFIILIDPSENGDFKKSYPQLFHLNDTNIVPGELLRQIDEKLGESKQV
jgi:hypothetical protein